MATTDTEWLVDGVSLNEYAWNITTLGDDRLAPPQLRGEDLEIPNMPGEVWQEKVVDSQVITLGMWVIGANPDGTVPAGGARRQFEDNWRTLRRLLWTPRRQFTLTKKFYVDGVLKTAEAKGQYNGGLTPKMSGPARATFTVDIKLTDPYFYTPQKSVPLSSASQVVNVEGDDLTTRILLTVEGSRNNVIIRNDTLGMQVEYHAPLNGGDRAEIDVKAFEATTYPSGIAAFTSTGHIRHTGAVSWLALQPGANTIKVSSASGSGLVTMAYREAWL